MLPNNSISLHINRIKVGEGTWPYKTSIPPFYFNKKLLLICSNSCFRTHTSFKVCKFALIFLIFLKFSLFSPSSLWTSKFDAKNLK